LLRSLNSPISIEDYELSVTASIGICVFPEDGTDAETLRRNADSAMYNAKSLGRNRFQCYDPKAGVRALERLELSQGLSTALKYGQFELFYQPQIDLDGRLHRLEALLRWNHPKHGIISPVQFIPLAEENGLIVPIGTWVVEEACRQCAEWHAAGFPRTKVAVNVSALQFYYSDFVEVVRGALAKSNLAPEFLQVELTESVLMRSVGESARQLQRLRNAGISIAVDDFGTDTHLSATCTNFRWTP
jgi:FOG: EAL domain